MDDKLDRQPQLEVVGLIPAAGRATRLAPLPCSKELFPVGFTLGNEGHNAIPKVVCHYLLEKMNLAGVTKAYIILRKGKWDIPAYLGDGTILGMYLSYLMMGLPYGVPYTIDQAYPFVENALIAFGFPDILIDPDDVFVQLLSRQRVSGADVVLGMFPADRPHKVDMLELDGDGKIKQILIKPRQTNLQFTWAVAVWTPVFSHFLHNYLITIKDPAEIKLELFMGEVFQVAIKEGLNIEAVRVSSKPFLDIGTADDLLRAAKRCIMELD